MINLYLSFRTILRNEDLHYTQRGSVNTKGRSIIRNDAYLQAVWKGLISPDPL